MAAVLETGVFVAYMLFVLGIGVYASRRVSHSPNEFYLAGRRLGSIVFTFTVMASLLSAFTFFAIGASSSNTGLGVFMVFAFEVLFFGLAYSTIGAHVNRLGRKFDIVTPSEYLQDRFNNDIPMIVYLLMSVIFLTLLAAVQVIGGAIALEILLGIPYLVGAIGIVCFMAIYIHISGMQGVVWSDVLQGAMMFVGLVGSFILVLAVVGPDELASGVMQNSPDLFAPAGPLQTWTPLYVLTFGAPTFFAVMAYPHTYQRFLAAKSISTLRKSGMLLPLVGVPIMFTGAALGAWSVGIVPNPPNPDYVIPLLIEGIAPSIVFAVVVSAAVAALMSTTDSILLSICSMVSGDIYGQYVNPNLGEDQEVTVAQWFLLVLVGLALLIAIVRPATIFTITELAAAGHGAAFPALFLSLFWKPSTSLGASTSIVTGVLVAFLFGGGVLPSPFFGVHYSFLILVVSTVVFIAVSLVTSAPTDADEYIISTP